MNFNFIPETLEWASLQELGPYEQEENSAMTLYFVTELINFISKDTKNNPFNVIK